MYDLIIIGSGPAGLSAAVYAKRAMLDFTVVERTGFGGGQVVNTSQVDNYLGLYGEGGYEMSMKFKDHAKKLGVTFETGTVERIRQEQRIFFVYLADGSCMETKTVLIATGAKHRMLAVPGEQELTGKGVSYCATCDGMFFRDKEVAVVGGGDVALEDALYLSRICNRVYLIHRRETLRASKAMQEQIKQTENIQFLPFYEVKTISGQKKVEQLTLVQNQTGETKTLAVDGIFIAVGMLPESGAFGDILSLNETGYIEAGEDCITSTPGIFAAGDVRTKQVRQIVTAVADGACAVASIEHYLTT